MPTKAQMYAQMADSVAGRLTSSWQDWAAFLTTAARLYKYPYHEQLMIYAQRPEATACAEYELWNDKMGRYIRRGSKGIALVDDSGDTPRLRYVFDIADTGTRPNSRHPFLWSMEQEHIVPVQTMLERRYEISGDSLPQQLADVAGKLSDEFWADNSEDILRIVDDSFLEEYDDLNVAVQFKSAATISITYALMSRCGLEPEQYFDHEDFMAIFDFNTPSTVAALGTAVSQSCREVLRQIGITIQNVEREKLAERRTWDEQHHAGFQVLDSGWDIWIKNSGAGESILSAPFLLETTYPLSCAASCSLSCTLSCPLSKVMLLFLLVKIPDTDWKIAFW